MNYLIYATLGVVYATYYFTQLIMTKKHERAVRDLYEKSVKHLLAHDENFTDEQWELVEKLSYYKSAGDELNHAMTERYTVRAYYCYLNSISYAAHIKTAETLRRYVLFVNTYDRIRNELLDDTQLEEANKIFEQEKDNFTFKKTNYFYL